MAVSYNDPDDYRKPDMSSRPMGKTTNSGIFRDDSTKDNWESFDYNTPGEPMHPADHPAYNMPKASQHYAGDVIPFPITMEQSDLSRARQHRTLETEGVPIQRPGGNLGPAKILRGPGSND